MKLYEGGIKDFKTLLKNCVLMKLNNPEKTWQVKKQEELILRSDMAYELGGGTKHAISGLAFTTDETLVSKDGCYFVGKDLSDISEDCDYARITLIRLKKDAFDNQQGNEVYDMLRKIDFARYHVYPNGFMLRISAVKERECARVSKDAIKQGISFSHVGDCFAKEYHLRPEVEAVETYFITGSMFDFDICNQIVHKWEQITESLNRIFEGFTMDCGSCNLKEICDEVEGLREMHEKR